MNIKLRKFLEQTIKNYNKTLLIFDLDETILFTSSRIYVKNTKTGKIKKKLTNQEFNTYQLKRNEEFDFSEFRKSDFFQKTSIPNQNILNIIKSYQTIPNIEIVIMTARADFDNKEIVLSYLRSLGINVGHYKNNEIHIIRTGNIKEKITTSQKKQKMIRKLINKNNYDNIIFFDDNKENLEDFCLLKKEYNKINFNAFLVNNKDIKLLSDNNLNNNNNNNINISL